MKKQNKHEGMTLGFIHSSQAHYKNIIDKPTIMIGMYDRTDYGGGTSGEFEITWENLGSDLPKCAHIGMFEDCFSLLTIPVIQSFFADLSLLDETNPTEDQIIELLKKHGIEDLTEYKRPHQYDELKCYAVQYITLGNPVPHETYPSLNGGYDDIKKGIFLIDGTSEASVYEQHYDPEFYHKFVVLGVVTEIDGYLKEAKNRR